MKGKKDKKRKWYELEREQNDALRASVGAKQGDGLKLLEQARVNCPALYALYRDMSADRADAMVSLYCANPLLKLLFTGGPK